MWVNADHVQGPLGVCLTTDASRVVMHVHHAKSSNSKQGSATALEQAVAIIAVRGNAWRALVEVAVALWKCQLPGLTSVQKAACQSV